MVCLGRWSRALLCVAVIAVPSAVLASPAAAYRYAKGAVSDIECVSATSCIAVMDPEVAVGPLAARWDGTAWHPLTIDVTTRRGEGGRGLYAASCVASDACVVVGGSGLPPDGWNPFAEAGGLTTPWRPLASPPRLPDHPGFTLPSTLACAAADACMAGGATEVGAGEDRTVPWASRWNGRAWTSSRPPTPAGSFADFPGSVASMACPTRTMCIAAGEWDGRKDGALLDQWRNGRWRMMKLPAAATGAELDGVACTSATSCLAVGSYRPRRSAPLTLQWDGRTWRMARSPTGDTGDQQVTVGLGDISCPAAGLCVALSYATKPPRAWVWDHGRWRGQAMPEGRAGDGVFYYAISCPTTRRCYAVGDDMAARWNGRGWRRMAGPRL